MGDSYMRQVFISLLDTVRADHPDGALKDTNLTKAQLTECDTYYKYFSACGKVTPFHVRDCDNTVHILRTAKWKSSQIKDILSVFRQYLGRPNTFVIFGLGIHDMYHPETTIPKVLAPVLQLLNSSRPWPHFIWSAPHAPGLLKTPLVKQQQIDSVQKYNTQVNAYLRSHGVPILDGFAITKDGVMSYDGTHYGKGLNDVKVQLLLNYFAELRYNR